MDLLIFFAFPIATVIISIILQKLIGNPLLVAAFTFAVFLVVAFAIYDATFLVEVLIYTLISLLTAVIVCMFSKKQNENSCNCMCNRCNGRR